MSDPGSPFSDARLAKAVQPLADLPPNQVQIGVTAHATDQGVEIEGEKDLGRGWFAAGDAAWWKHAGWKAAAWIGWKGRSLR